MALLPVDDALAAILENTAPLPGESISIASAAHRVLAQDLVALRTQPPFSASAMDGYAVRHVDIVDVPVTLKVIGAAGAGHPFEGKVGAGECTRIFTGAPVPEGADTIIMQENTEVPAEGEITILQTASEGEFVRKAGLDFTSGEILLKAGGVLSPASLSLAAAMNHAEIPVVRKPRIAIIATGDELLPPGSEVGPGQIIASNSFGVAALVEKNGGIALDLGIVADTEEAHASAFDEAIRLEADILVTLGGASVGEHDLVQKVLVDKGAEIGFWRIAMRPGKPLLFGNLPHKKGKMRFLGLPGNPVSSLVCSLIFLQPLIAALSGRDSTNLIETSILGKGLKENDLRQDYLRAQISTGPNGSEQAIAFDLQDSSVLSLMSKSDCLIIRPPFAPAAKAGDACLIIRL